MKKRTIALLVIAISLIIIGGTGAAILYPKISKQALVLIDETLKSPEGVDTLEIDFHSYNNYKIEYSDDDSFSLNGRFTTLEKNDAKLMSLSKTNKKTKLKINSPEDRDFSFDFFNFWDGGPNEVVLKIPKSYKNLTINKGTGFIELAGLDMKKLNIPSTNGDFSIKDSHFSELITKNSYAAFTLINVKIDMGLDFETDGSISLDNVQAKHLKINSRGEDVSLKNVVADTQIKGTSCDVNIQNLTGKLMVSTDYGDIKYSVADFKNNVTLQSNSGSIDVNIINKPKNIEIIATSNDEEPDIFDEERTSLTIGKNGPKLHCKTDYGPISITNEEFEDWDNFSNDFMEDDDDVYEEDDDFFEGEEEI